MNYNLLNNVTTLMNLSNLISSTGSNQSDEGKRTSAGGILSGHGVLEPPLSRFLIQAVIIILISRFLHIFLRKLRQPRVIAEMLGGICLGPSVLGQIPGFTDTFFPKSSLGFLTLVANIGLVFYLFLVGLELEPQAFLNNMKLSLLISAAGIILPFSVGVACSYGMYTYLLVPNTYEVPFTSFLLFTGVAISITAFPVLARILTEKKLLHTPVGLTTISAAALDDATAWSLLALVMSIVNAGDNLTALYVFLMAVAYTLILLIGLRLLLNQLFNRMMARTSNPVTQFLVAMVFCLLFLSAFMTELIGIHAIFGAFIFGLVIPRSNNLAIRLTEKIEDVIIVGFLPLFFASSGLKTNIGLLTDGVTWLWLFIVILVACSGKLLGCALVARASGINWRESFSIGVLMNTKGLVELIVLNIGYDAHVINDRIFLIMVMMALVTTFMTTPIISVLYPPKYYLKGTTPPPKDSEKVERNIAMTDRSKSITEFLPEDIKLPVKMVIIVDELEPVPVMTRLVWLFKPVKNFAGDLFLTAVKVIEPSERSSSVMIASQMDEIEKNDPALCMLRMFGNLTNVPTNSFVTMTSVDDIGEEVSFLAQREQASLILLPWNDRLVIGSILSSSPQEKLKNILKSADVTTAVFVPHMLKADQGPPTTYAKILVLFFGGCDDREAIKIGLRMYRHGMNAHVTLVQVSGRRQSTVSVLNKQNFSAHVLSTITDEEDLNSETQKISSANNAKAFQNQAAPIDDDEWFQSLQILALRDGGQALSMDNIGSCSNDLKSMLETALNHCLTFQPDLIIIGRRPVLAADHFGVLSTSNPSIEGFKSTLEINSNSLEKGIPPTNISRKGTSISLANTGRKSSHPKLPIINRIPEILTRSVSHTWSSPELEIGTAGSDRPLQHTPRSFPRKTNILTEILGTFGEMLYESNLRSSLLVVKAAFSTKTRF